LADLDAGVVPDGVDPIKGTVFVRARPVLESFPFALQAGEVTLEHPVPVAGRLPGSLLGQKPLQGVVNGFEPSERVARI
jgi:hypothetical protein